jgi:peptidoglycan/xylan/chitin deacetylase (PgdA/CDA1 family)
MDRQQLNRRRPLRAQERRRQAFRRRLAALGALTLLLIAVIVVVVGAAGTSGPGNRPNHATAVVKTGHRDRRTGHAHAHGASTAGALSGATGRPGTAAVPILMYHVIAPPPPGAPFPGLYVLPAEFAAQMQALKSAGWTAVTQDQLRAYWQHGARLPAGKPIVITFDNGYHSQYAQALPVLRRMGWVANENIQLSGLPPSQGGLTDPEIRALVAAGWELDTQGISHADLVTESSSGLHYQVATARQIIRRRFGVPVNWFCYPSGHYDASVIDAVRAAGYVGSTTVVPGWAAPAGDSYRLPRLRVLGGTSPTALLEQIATYRHATAPPASYTGA